MALLDVLYFRLLEVVFGNFCSVHEVTADLFLFCGVLFFCH